MAPRDDSGELLFGRSGYATAQARTVVSTQVLVGKCPGRLGG
jgi:hypothetical protein